MSQSLHRREDIFRAQTTAKPTARPPALSSEVPWQKFLSGTFWKPLRHVQYVVDRDCVHWASSPHMVVLLMQSYDL